MASFLEWNENRPNKKLDQIREQAEMQGLVMVEESESTLASGSTGKYKEAVIKLESWGFTNVKAVPLEDLISITAFVADGLVEDITINGRTFTAGDCFEKDAPVIITFHSQPGAEGYSSSDN